MEERRIRKKILFLIFAVCLAMPLFSMVPFAKAAYVFTFHGVYDEPTGVHLDDCNATVYFSDASAETFEINESITKSWSSMPTHIVYEVTPYYREFWFDPSNDNGTDIYVFNSDSNDTVPYTLLFNDLAGQLENYPYVEIQTVINGSMAVVEKRKVDVENKVLVNVVPGQTYTVDFGVFTYGSLLFTTDTLIELDIRGLEFPENVIVGYRYVRMYATRNSDNGIINAYYSDSLSATSLVEIYIYFQSNDSLAFYQNSTSTPWTFSYAGCDEETDYLLYMEATHATFGTLTYRQVLSRVYSIDSPFSLSFLGSLPFDTAYIIPALIILFVAGAFSALNTVVGLFATISVASIFGILGWLPLDVNLLVFVFGLVIIFAIATLRRRTYG